MENKHKPNCAINQSCAVYHENGICPHYKDCNCGIDTPKDTKEEEYKGSAGGSVVEAIEEMLKYKNKQKEEECACGYKNCPAFTPQPKAGSDWELDLESIVFQIDCGEKESDYFLEQLKKLFTKTLKAETEKALWNTFTLEQVNKLEKDAFKEGFELGKFKERKSIREQVENYKKEQLNSHWLYLVKPEQAFTKTLDDITTFLSDKGE